MNEVMEPRGWAGKRQKSKAKSTRPIFTRKIMPLSRFAAVRRSVGLIGFAVPDAVCQAEKGLVGGHKMVQGTWRCLPMLFLVLLPLALLLSSVYVFAQSTPAELTDSHGDHCAVAKLVPRPPKPPRLYSCRCAIYLESFRAGELIRGYPQMRFSIDSSLVRRQSCA
jgi:hypothetical protein